MYFNHAFRKDFFVQSSAVANLNSLPNATATTALTAGRVGFFVKTSATNSTLVSTNTATILPFTLIQGSYYTNDQITPALGGYKESIKSKVINPKYISRVITVAAKAARQQVIQVPVTCGLTCDTTYRLRVDVKGSPALRFLSHNMYRVLDSYTGCCNTTDPTLQKDPVVTLLNWADQINTSPIFNTMVQARAYKLSTTQAATSIVTPATTTSIVLGSANFTTANGVAIGQKVVGTGIPANSFITAFTSGTSITVTYPTQATAPTISATVSVKFYNDLYSGAQGTYGYTATVAGGSATVPTVIPGTGSQTGVGGSAVISAGTATNANIAQNLAGTTNGAIIYQAAADAASFSVDAHIELTGAYIETSFGTCTFTPTDKYDLEPLLMYTAIVDETGDPCSSFCFTTTHSNTGADTAANLATVIQDPIQASGYGETIIRNMILSSRYLQNAYPDSSRVESLRMREIEADPVLSTITKSSLYDQILILHSVPRFNNPTGTFDNDQYLLVVSAPAGTTTTAFTNFLVNSANLAQGSGAVVLESY